MRTVQLQASTLPMIPNDAPCVVHPAPLTGTPMIALDKVAGVYRRRRHGSFTSVLSVTIADYIASK